MWASSVCGSVCAEWAPRCCVVRVGGMKWMLNKCIVYDIIFSSYIGVAVVCWHNNWEICTKVTKITTLSFWLGYNSVSMLMYWCTTTKKQKGLTSLIFVTSYVSESLNQIIFSTRVVGLDCNLSALWLPVNFMLKSHVLFPQVISCRGPTALPLRFMETWPPHWWRRWVVPVWPMKCSLTTFFFIMYNATHTTWGNE